MVPVREPPLQITKMFWLLPPTTFLTFDAVKIFSHTGAESVPVFLAISTLFAATTRIINCFCVVFEVRLASVSVLSGLLLAVNSSTFSIRIFLSLSELAKVLPIAV